MRSPFCLSKKTKREINTQRRSLQAKPKNNPTPNPKCKWMANRCSNQNHSFMTGIRAERNFCFPHCAPLFFFQFVFVFRFSILQDLNSFESSFSISIRPIRFWCAPADVPNVVWMGCVYQVRHKTERWHVCGAACITIFFFFFLNEYADPFFFSKHFIFSFVGLTLLMADEQREINIIKTS